MLIPVFILAAALLQVDVPPVPGLCSAPLPADRETLGCYKTGELEIRDAPPELYWQIYQYRTLEAATAEAARHRWSMVAQAHSRTWLYVLSRVPEQIRGGTKRAMVGPLQAPAGPVMAHFAEAIFPPGMQTRVHSHPGPEAFYVVEGQQCMETPNEKQLIAAGGTYIVKQGPHIQAAPDGRRNLVLILSPKGEPAVISGGDWKPSGFCSVSTR